MTTLITGASGLIGSRLCRTLAEEGSNVVGLIHSHPVAIHSNLRTDTCDLIDYDSVNAIVSLYKPDTVFHFAAHLPSTPNPDFIRVNVLGTSNLLDTCYRNGVKNFIYASSMSVYSAPPEYLPVDEKHPTRPDDVYGKTKLIGELLCECYSRVMRTMIVRFSSVFGAGDNSRVAYHFMKVAVSGQPILVDGDGSQSSDFIYVDDAVRGAILALEKGKSGEVYNIGSGKETSVFELAYHINRLVNPAPGVLLSRKPATRPFRFVADIRKAREKLGYEPSGLEDGLREYREEILK